MIDRQELREGLQTIAQLRKSAEIERKKIAEGIANIQEIEHQITLRRKVLGEFERMMFNKCDELFNLVYSDLPIEYVNQ